MSRLEGNMTVLDQIVRQQEEINALLKERDELTEYIAKHNELIQKLTIELAEYQVKERKVGIKRAALAKVGADKGEWKIVPVEPTLEMKMAASDYLIEHQNDEFYAEDIYKVMVAKVGADKEE